MARHALLVGVSRFKDSRLNTLNAPANDVEAFAAILRDPARGGFDGVKVSLDPDFLTFRDNLSALFNKRDPDDLLLLYYSGHGILRSDNRLYLTTIETDFEQPEARGVAASEIREAMDRTRAERQVLVLDCCHSGAFAPGAKGAGATAVTSDTFGSGSYALTASDAQQFAWDGDRLASGNAATRTLSHFTSWLVDGLGRGDAAPDDPDISMDALFRYICRRAKAAGSLATPQRFVERGSEDLIIGRNPAAAGAASVQALAGQLGNADWTVRLAAAAALGKLARKSASRDAARDALADRLGAERDFKVRGALLRGLELPSEAAPREPESPPPEPPLEGAKPHADPVTLPPAQGGRDALARLIHCFVVCSVPDRRTWLIEAPSGRDFGSEIVGAQVDGMGVFWGDSPVPHGPASCKLRAMPRNNSASGHAAANAMRTRVAVSVIRPAILIRRMRKVANSAVASGCGLGMASRTVSISQ